MNIRPVKTKKDYTAALKRIEQLWGAKDKTPDGDEFEILFTLVEAYEDKHYPIPTPHPIEAIKFRMEQGDVDERELTKILGGRSRNQKYYLGEESFH